MKGVHIYTRVAAKCHGEMSFFDARDAGAAKRISRKRFWKSMRQEVRRGVILRDYSSKDFDGLFYFTRLLMEVVVKPGRDFYGRFRKGTLVFSC